MQLFRQLCDKYKQHSVNQKEQENTRRKVLASTMMEQKKLDAEFMERLKSFDLDMEDDDDQ